MQDEEMQKWWRLWFQFSTSVKVNSQCAASLKSCHLLRQLYL